MSKIISPKTVPEESEVQSAVSQSEDSRNNTSESRQNNIPGVEYVKVQLGIKFNCIPNIN